MNSLLIYGVAAAVIGGAGFGYGYHVADKGRLEVIAQLEADVQIQEVQADIAVAHLERQREQREAAEEQLRAEVDRIAALPHYRNQCLDDAGLRIANDAIKGAR